MSTPEYAVTICQSLETGQLVRGNEAKGSSPYSVRLMVGCPPNTNLFALFHTHPLEGGGRLEPSLADIREAKKLGISRLCISVPEKNLFKCFNI